MCSNSFPQGWKSLLNVTVGNTNKYNYLTVIKSPSEDNFQIFICLQSIIGDFKKEQDEFVKEKNCKRRGKDRGKLEKY